MPHVLRSRQPSRFCAALVALCYLWLGLVVSFQHTHGVSEPEETRTVASGFAPASSARQGQTSRPRVAKQTRMDASRCLACDWQMLSASPALPVLRWELTPNFAPRAITTFPRYLRTRTFFTSPRGPPAV